MLSETHFNSELLDSIWKNLSTAVILLDRDFKLVYANDSASELLGLGPKRIINQPFDNLFNYHSIDLKRIAQYSLFDGVDCHQHRADVVFVDSRHAKLTISTRRISNNDDNYILFECRQMDDEIRHDQASNQMHQYQAARNLIRGLAHEIKNPLGGIRGAAQLLQYEVDQQERDQCAELIIEQADRLRELVDRLLGPNQLPHKSYGNIHQALESVIKLSMLDNNANITLVKDYDPSIPSVYIDQGKIQQVVLNIIRNAQQALVDGGEIRIKTRINHQHRRPGKAPKKTLLIQISDNGPGIDKSLRETLFYPMITNKENGSGLGLSIAQTLVDQHDGHIDCDSWPGHTEFNIYLPFTD
ncbi:nitrogen regulation protein NR(II) [Pseudoalteromonas sp. Hal040]|jgi:two-component system nitrogen regulation sensor histidine kinase GlnL|uniref:Sensory histidine kinase/phosphatase NtrB n=1 Tax=Pseudoalteromonas gelatinilytica TaxID=1703256 RepID=A0ABQ1TN04_9GAMM|nr:MULTISPECIES: nitrogen regulation protein NR(II) [Pseudoalteromonas]MBN4057448.1 nitrogen regulation protein NR(II) [Pseudoalteromonas haloplanktis]TMO26957.1 nitrogen regulation protein NR(II) [Pseudoalteromonas sp. S4492]GGE97352.1 two-component system sensor histidine kinase NtrB [Pseudoalteromonas profundi]